MLVEEIARREKFLDNSIQLLNERLKSYERIGGALDVALKGGDINAVRTALNELDERPNHAEILREQIKMLSRASSMRIPRDEFLKAHREARTLLKGVCELRLEQTQANLERVTIEEQSRLDSLGEGYEASASPLVKRGASKVEQLKGMLSRIESDQDLPMYFVNFAGQLLEP